MCKTRTGYTLLHARLWNMDCDLSLVEIRDGDHKRVLVGQDWFSNEMER